jgi:lysophospholipase L1-like esterase
VFRLILVLFSLALFLATGEIALRVFYRDAGTRTLGGPGGRGFEHLTVSGDQRGRFDSGEKVAARPRIMIVGDSITWGQGVRNWQDTWPEQLALALERAGTPHEIAVDAFPGRDIPQLVDEVEHWLPQLKPDVFIYQWYVNDVEVEGNRPPNRRVWRNWFTHDFLQRRSYLYYFVDNRLASTLPPPDRSYVDYVLQDYAPGTFEWAEFERYFHRLAAQVAEVVPRRLLLLYPQVPFREQYPLQPIHERVSAMAGAHRLNIPPAAWVRHSGQMVESPDAPFKQAIRVERGPAAVVETRDYYIPASGAEVVVTFKVDTDAPNPHGVVTAIDLETKAEIARADMAGRPGGGWQEVAMHVPAAAKPRFAKFLVNSLASGPFAVGLLSLPVDYGFTVVDPTAELNTFNTHASIFDSHPNERAHKLLAERLFQALHPAR